MGTEVKRRAAMRVYTVLILLLVHHSSQQEEECPEGWVFLGNLSTGQTQRCYKVLEQHLTQPEALAACRALVPGADLASIHSLEENDLLYEYAYHFGGFGDSGYWIGATDAAKEGTWTWTDGSSWDFAEWGDPEYEHGQGGPTENCVFTSMFGHSGLVEWDDYNCDCEYCKMLSICGL